MVWASTNGGTGNGGVSALILRQDTQFSNSAGYANYNDILAVKNLRDRSYPPEKKTRMAARKVFRQNLPLSQAKKRWISQAYWSKLGAGYRLLVFGDKWDSFGNGLDDNYEIYAFLQN
ncbi:uncharacterized protein LOC110188040 [Drosophila serrata]|uniref:uncharacterized protein LOC110188040 n=1 Tax=Drosophila serrata TaxID=7274 RepID=UPI000A1CF9F1|nr:uncharacterized protein LOC110188040 [Drosophila serrata]